MRAISVLSFDAGTSTRACLARAALRMRVSKSEMGSVCIFFSRPLPASLQHAGDFAPQRQTAEADAAHLEVAHSRQHHVAEPVHELVHTVATQGHAAANRHPLADLEVRNRLLRARDDRLLPGDLPQL